MKTSKSGVDLIKKFEGLKRETYICPAGVPTIGYGTTRISGSPVPMGMKINQADAEKFLKEDLVVFENAVKQAVKVNLNQNQFDALVSFVYNVGVGNFSKSTLLLLLNKNKLDEAANQLLRWVKAKGKELPGLVKRREAERELFLKE